MGSVSTLLQDVNQRVKKMEHDMSRLLGKQHDPDMIEGKLILLNSLISR